MVYLDNAATSHVKPKSVMNSVVNALRFYSTNAGRGGHDLAVKAGEKVYNVRKIAADFFSLEDPAGVVFTPSCTYSINFVLKGVLNKGDALLISNLEHNAVVRPAESLKRNRGVQYAFFDAFAPDIKAELESKIQPNTKMIFCTHASNVCGKVLPVRQIGEFCRENGLLFGVDCAQTAGVFDISMQEMNIDYLCVASHKGLFSPMGIGLLLVRSPIKNTVIEGGTGANSLQIVQPDDLPERLESGTLNLPAIFGVGAGINFVKSMGVNKIHLMENTLCKRLKRGLDRMNRVEKYWFEEESAPVVSFNVIGCPSEETAQFLNSRGFAVRAGLHCAPIAHNTLKTLPYGTVRVSPSFFNTKAEIDSFLTAIEYFSKRSDKNS